MTTAAPLPFHLTLLPVLPAVALVVAALAVTVPEISLGLYLAAALVAVLAVLGALILRACAAGSMQVMLMGMVAGMALRGVGLIAFCLIMMTVDGAHLLTACLAAAAGLVASLIIDSAVVSRRLSAVAPESVPEVASA